MRSNSNSLDFEEKLFLSRNWRLRTRFCDDGRQCVVEPLGLLCLYTVQGDTKGGLVAQMARLDAGRKRHWEDEVWLALLPVFVLVWHLKTRTSLKFLQIFFFNVYHPRLPLFYFLRGVSR
jgi:hypothetical protein